MLKENMEMKALSDNDAILNQLLLLASNELDPMLLLYQLQHAKNYLLIVSPEGNLIKASTSFIHSFAYAEHELLSIPLTELLINGTLVNSKRVTSYYFKTSMRCKNQVSKMVTWRLIPDVLTNSFVYLGWEEKA
jgi:hypothetical protein